MVLTAVANVEARVMETMEFRIRTDGRGQGPCNAGDGADGGPTEGGPDSCLALFDALGHRRDRVGAVCRRGTCATPADVRVLLHRSAVAAKSTALRHPTAALPRIERGDTDGNRCGYVPLFRPALSPWVAVSFELLAPGGLLPWGGPLRE